MQAHRLGATMGLTWIREGFALFRRQPFSLISLALGIMVISTLCTMLPIPGVPALLIVTPGLSCAFMYACRTIEAGQFARPGLLFAAFREPAPRTRTMLKLGLTYLLMLMAGSFLLALLWMQFDGGAMKAAVEASAADPAAVPVQLAPAFYPLSIAVVGLWLLVTVLLWFAPVLIAWHGLNLRKAVFFSVVAIFRSLPALVVFAIIVGLVTAAIGAVLDVVIESLALPEPWRSLLAVPVIGAWTSIASCSVYSSYRHAFSFDAS
ncbi:BPSS1780 family membrane protein [soil metagenome]